MSESNKKKNDLTADLNKLSRDPFKILKMMTSMPPAESILLKEQKAPESERPPDSPVHSFKPLKPHFRHFDFQSPERPERKKFYKDLDQSDAQLNIFKRKRRHREDMSDTLSVISQHSTKSFSRFSRLFEKIPSTQELLDTQNLTFSTQERVTLQRDIDKMEGIATQQSFQTQSSFQTQESAVPTQESPLLSLPKPTQESLFHSVLVDTQEPAEKEELKSQREEDEEVIERISPSPIIPTTQSEHEETTPMIPNDDFAMDDADYGMGEDAGHEMGEDDLGFDEQEAPNDDMKLDEKSDTSVIPPKRVTQGDSFVGKKMKEPVNRRKKHLLLPHNRTKAIFQSYLGFNKKLNSTIDLSRATNLFCDQLVDDLKSYKNNQPEEYQDEITTEDVILLMQRQRLISDMSSLAALAQKYLPREYNDVVSQAAIAYNQLYPGSNQKYSDDFYYYNYDNALDEDEE